MAWGICEYVLSNKKRHYGVLNDQLLWWCDDEICHILPKDALSNVFKNKISY